MTQPFDQARVYLARVLPWPQDGEEQTWQNIHTVYRPTDYDTADIWKKHRKEKRLPWGGRACATLHDAVRAVEFAMKSDDTRDVYVCMSAQREAEEKISTKGFRYHKPIRNQQNAVRLKAFFIDIDIKDGGYATPEEAVTALGKFLQASQLPKPTIVVSSGGGMHVYWTVSRALTVYEWEPLAFALANATKQLGLKCDAACTIDSARVLRVPDTFNRKIDPPRPVRIVGTPNDFDYTVERLEQALAPFKVATPRAALPPRAPLVGVNDDLSAGIELSSVGPIDLKTVIPECGFLREALQTGGKDYPNPLWNLTTLASTFCLQGRDAAHLMARSHPGYTKESTDQLFDRKERDKVEKNLGWPSCATISATGAAACATCPHSKAGKSPFNFALRPVAAPAVPNPALMVVAPPPSNNDLPDGYSRTPAGLVTKRIVDDKGITHDIPIYRYPMRDAWVQRDPWVFHFTSDVGTGKAQHISIDVAVLASQEMRKVLQAQGMGLMLSEVRDIGDFLVSWLHKLQNTRDAVISSAPFGWHLPHGKYEGFVFGGVLHTPTGERQAANPDPVIANQYAPIGEIQPWIDAAEMVTSQGRPGLDAIIASSFGAPLVRFTGQSGLQMSVYSPESGIGKTTTLRVAQAVWGDPVKAPQMLSDTQNSVLNKIGQLVNLPMYWDELKTSEDTKRFVDLVFRLSLGKEKSRLTSQAHQKTVGSWQTLMVSCSNDSILDVVAQRTKGTTAGLYRVFEYQVQPGTTGQISPSDAQRRVAKLNDNYGAVGQEYAKWLGSNFVKVDKEVGDLLKALEQEVVANADERFWVALIACVLMGARYANQLGYTKIDEAGLRVFMLGVLAEMRAIRASSTVDMTDATNVSSVIAGFLSEMTRHSLYTNRINVGRGRPAPGTITVQRDVSKLDGVYVQIGLEDKLMRVSSTALSEWCAKKEISRHAFTRAMKEEFGFREVLGRLGSGTQFAGPTQHLLEVDLAAMPQINIVDEA